MAPVLPDLSVGLDHTAHTHVTHIKYVTGKMSLPELDLSIPIDFLYKTRRNGPTFYREPRYELHLSSAIPSQKYEC
jgi:hypothetical protein